MIDKKTLKKGDYVVCECEATHHFAIARFYELDYRENIYGAQHFTATLGGFNGEVTLTVSHMGWMSCWWTITRMATDEERANLDAAISERGYTFDGEFYHRPEQVVGPVWHKAKVEQPDKDKEIIVISGDIVYYGKGLHNGMYLICQIKITAFDEVHSVVNYNYFKPNDKWAYLSDIALQEQLTCRK